MHLFFFSFFCFGHAAYSGHSMVPACSSLESMQGQYLLQRECLLEMRCSHWTPGFHLCNALAAPDTPTSWCCCQAVRPSSSGQTPAGLEPAMAAQDTMTEPKILLMHWCCRQAACLSSSSQTPAENTMVAQDMMTAPYTFGDAF